MGVRQVGKRQAHGLGDRLWCAAGVAVEDHRLIAAGSDHEAGLGVVVGWAAGGEAAAGFLQAVQFRQDEFT